MAGMMDRKRDKLERSVDSRMADGWYNSYMVLDLCLWVLNSVNENVYNIDTDNNKIVQDNLV